MEQLDTLRLAAKLAGYLCLFGGAGALGYLLLVDGTQRLARVLAVVGTLGALLVLPLRLLFQVVFLGGGWSAGLDPELWALVLDTPPGQAAAVQGGGLILIFLAVLAPALRWPCGLPGALIVTVGQGLSGHTAGLSPSVPGQALLVLHLVGVAVWLGSLWPLLRAADGPTRRTADVMERFSRLAIWLVPLLLAAGLALAVWLVGSLGALIGTTYGLLLLAKLGLVGLLLALATANKWRFVPRLAEGDLDAAVHLRASIRLEVVLGLAILSVTAALTTITGAP